MNYKIAVIKGDGIGPEIVDQALLVLDRVAERFGHSFSFEYLLAGGAALDVHGIPLPEETITKSKECDAALLGAVGDPKWDNEPGANRPEKAILGLREHLGLFANLRPATVFEELSSASPLKDEIISDGFDILIVRELTGGIYFGTRGTVNIENGNRPDNMSSLLLDNKNVPDGKFAYDVEQYSEFEIARIGHTAFEMARKRNKHVTSVDKANVLDSSRLWRAVMEEVAKDYPDVQLDHLYVDNTAQQLIKNPKQFDVIVTSNIFGDILSDEASQITGSIGMLASASLGIGNFGLYEPIHGSAPKYTGMDRANPIATILSAAMMLRYSLDLSEEADAIEKAVEGFLKAGYRTADIMADGKKPIGTAAAGTIIANLI